MSTNRISHSVLSAHLALISASVIWGIAGPVIKYTLAYIPPATFLFVRMLIVCVLVLPFLIIELKRTPINTKDYVNFFLLGLFSQTQLIIVYLSYKYTTAIDIGIIGISGTIITMYLGHYFYNERIDRKVAVGASLAAIGTLAVILEPLVTGNRANVNPSFRIVGNLLAFISVVAWSFYLLWSKLSMGERSGLLKKTLSFVHIKPMTKVYSPTLIVYITFFVGLATVLPFAVLEYFGFFGETNFYLGFIDPKGIAGILYMALLSSVVAYLAIQWGLQKAHVRDTAVYGYLSTLITFPAAYLLLGEVPSKIAILAMLIIFSGVAIAQYDSILYTNKDN